MILRGAVDDVKKAGPSKEAVIASACLHDKWSAEVLQCIGSTTTAADCLEQLTDDQRASYDQELSAWADLFGEAVADFDTPGLLEIECSTVIGDVAAYAPVLAVTGEERTLAVALRTQAIDVLCNATWTHAVKQCLDTGGGVELCRQQLDPTSKRVLADKLAEIDAVLAKIATTKKKPAATYDCKRVGIAHYSDAAWKGVAEVPLPAKATAAEKNRAAADRKKMIADSRVMIATACVSEQWSATARACIVGGGGSTCFHGMTRPAAAWTFPAPGVVQRTGIADCDSYAASTAAMLTCDRASQSMRDMLRARFDQQREAWSKLDRAAIANDCQQGETSLRQIARSLGCTI